MTRTGLAWLALGACGGPPTTSPIDGDPLDAAVPDARREIEDLGADYADAICRKALECCEDSELIERIPNLLVEDYAGCRIFARTDFDTRIRPAFERAVEAGRLDEAAFRQELDALRGMSCQDFSLTSANSAFAAITVGLVGEDGSCESGFECGQNLFCSPEGVCQPRSGLDQACSNDLPCAEDLYCSASEVCHAREPLGASCAADTHCHEGTCVGNPPLGSGVCAAICDGDGVGVGPDPDPTTETAAARIAETYCEKVFTCCEENEIRRSTPAMVDSEWMCGYLYGPLAGGLTLAVHNAVREGRVTVDSSAFEACFSAYQNAECGDFAADADALDACGDAWVVGRVADGDPCVVGLECASGFCENEAWFAEGTCSPRLAEDDACPNGGCADTHYCDGTCRPDSALGEACDEFPEIFAPTNFGDIYGIHESCAAGRCAYLGGATLECAAICDGI